MAEFFKEEKYIIALLSEKKDGSMKNIKNKEIFLKKNKIEKNRIVLAGMIHGNKVGRVDFNSPQIIEGVDALVTNEKINLGVTVADCLPVYFYDSKNGVVGMAHAGWRGIISGVLDNTSKEMISLGSEVKEIKIVIGPGIRRCHFEIKEDILFKFEKWKKFINYKEKNIFLDLFGIVKQEFLNRGILLENIYDSGECTYYNNKRYFSYCRDKPKKVEVMMAMIGMK